MGPGIKSFHFLKEKNKRKEDIIYENHNNLNWTVWTVQKYESIIHSVQHLWPILMTFFKKYSLDV